MRRLATALLLLPLLSGHLWAEDSLRFDLSGKTSGGVTFKSTLTLDKRSDGQYRAVRTETRGGAAETRLIGVARLQAPSLQIKFRPTPGLAGALGKGGSPESLIRARYRLQGEVISGWVELPQGSGTRERVREEGKRVSAKKPGPPAAKKPGRAAAGRSYHVKPASGSPAGDGSLQRPWRTLQGVAASGKLKLLGGGDTLLLYSGNHGSPRISGENSGLVSIAAAPGQKPQLARLTLSQGKNWRIVGLTISPSFGSKPYAGNIVTLAESGPSSAITLEGCFVYTGLDSSNWKVADWLAANNGIEAGRGGRGITLRNNHVLNTRFAISVRAPQSLCEGNLVSNFSGDGIWVLDDDIRVLWNVVKNVFVSQAVGDANHDDGIQCFVPGGGRTAIKRATIRGNLIVSHEDDDQPLPGDLQGIGFFDGPLVEFEISENVILTSHWHGLTLVGAQSCRVRQNVVFSRWKTPASRPWILLGEKQPGLTRGNLVQDNYAHSFNLKADGQVTSKNNRVVTAGVFRQRAAALKARIEKTFGARHPLSLHPRVRPLGGSQ